MKTYRAWLAVLSLLLAGAALAQEALVPIRGTVSGSPESVSFAGEAKVTSRFAPDPDFNRPRLVLTIDLTEVSGTGASSGAKYVISGPEMMQRRVASSHAVSITFPFKDRGGALRTGMASFALDFDVNTGAMTGASGSVSTPRFAQ